MHVPSVYPAQESAVPVVRGKRIDPWTALSQRLCQPPPHQPTHSADTPSMSKRQKVRAGHAGEDDDHDTDSTQQRCIGKATGVHSGTDAVHPLLRPLHMRGSAALTAVRMHRFLKLV